MPGRLQSIMEQAAPLSRQGREGAQALVPLLAEAVRLSGGDPNLTILLAKALADLEYFGEALALATRVLSAGPHPMASALSEIILDLAPPMTVVLEVSTVCNLRCPLCHRGAGLLDRPNRLMGPELFQRVWSRLAKRTGRVDLTGLGESFLNPRVHEYIEAVKAAGAYLCIDTNGNGAMDAERLVRAEVDEVVFAMDGVDQATYERYRRGGDFQKACSSLNHLARAKARLGSPLPRLVFKYIMFRHNERHEDQAQELARRLGADEFRLDMCNFHPDFPPSLLPEFLPRQPRGHRLDYIDFAGQEVGPQREFDSQHCAMILKSFMVSVSGRVLPCCNADESLSFGSLAESDFPDIWSSAAYRGFRQAALLDRWRMPVCRKCSTRTSSSRPGVLAELGLRDFPSARPADSGHRVYFGNVHAEDLVAGRRGTGPSAGRQGPGPSAGACEGLRP